MGRLAVLTEADRKERRAQLRYQEEREEEQRRRAKMNSSFVQFEEKNILNFASLIASNSLAARLLVLFSLHMSRQNVVLVKFKDMQEATGLSRSALAKAIKHLAAEKWIEIVKVGAANKYTVNAYVFWKNTADLKKFSFVSPITPVAKKKKGQEPTRCGEWKRLRAQYVPVLVPKKESGMKARE